MQQHLVLHVDIAERNTTLAIHHRKTKVLLLSQRCSLLSRTIFEIALLEDVNNNISISAASFESRAQVYNENFHKVNQDILLELTAFGHNTADEEHPWRLTEKRVEDAWFL